MLGVRAYAYAYSICGSARALPHLRVELDDKRRWQERLVHLSRLELGLHLTAQLLGGRVARLGRPFELLALRREQRRPLESLHHQATLGAEGGQPARWRAHGVKGVLRIDWQRDYQLWKVRHQVARRLTEELGLEAVIELGDCVGDRAWEIVRGRSRPGHMEVKRVSRLGADRAW